MQHNNFIKKIEALGNVDKALQMSAYMRNQFKFLGITSPERREATKEYLKTLNKELDWDFIDECWANPYREFQYIACDYIKKMKKYLQVSDLERIKSLVVQKSWWDTVDNLVRPVGFIVQQNPKISKLMLKWSIDDNFWIRRTAILHQLSQKEQTNKVLLDEIISNNFNQKEFFINKAIGWALREYSKTNPEWVKEFLIKNQESLSSLSIREGSKYL